MVSIKIRYPCEDTLVHLTPGGAGANQHKPHYPTSENNKQAPLILLILPAESGPGVGFDWLIWGGNVYKGWELVDYAAISVAESAQLMLTPGRRCENGKPAPVSEPDWIKFTKELAEAGKAAYVASQTRNQETISDSTNQLNDSCMNCHRVYRGRTHCVK